MTLEGGRATADFAAAASANERARCASASARYASVSSAISASTAANSSSARSARSRSFWRVPARVARVFFFLCFDGAFSAGFGFFSTVPPAYHGAPVPSPSTSTSASTPFRAAVGGFSKPSFKTESSLRFFFPEKRAASSASTGEAAGASGAAPAAPNVVAASSTGTTRAAGDAVGAGPRSIRSEVRLRFFPVLKRDATRLDAGSKGFGPSVEGFRSVGSVRVVAAPTVSAAGERPSPRRRGSGASPLVPERARRPPRRRRAVGGGGGDGARHGGGGGELHRGLRRLRFRRPSPSPSPSPSECSRPSPSRTTPIARALRARHPGASACADRRKATGPSVRQTVPRNRNARRTRGLGDSSSRRPPLRRRGPPRRARRSSRSRRRRPPGGWFHRQPGGHRQPRARPAWGRWPRGPAE